MYQTLEMVLAPLAMFLFGSGMLIMGMVLGRRRRNFAKYGIKTEATIRGYSPWPDGDKLSLEAEYRTAEGEYIIARHDVAKSHYYRKRHPVGSRIQVRYLPDKPKKFDTVPGNPGMIFGEIIMVLTGIGLYALGLFTAFCALFARSLMNM